MYRYKKKKDKELLCLEIDIPMVCLRRNENRLLGKSTRDREFQVIKYE